jgi:hypothetical protein
MIAAPNVGKDLLCIHQAVTRGLLVTAQNCQGTGPQPQLRAGFQKYVLGMISLLDSHHSGEDEIAFPFWKKKMPSAPFSQLTGDHQRMLPILDGLSGWANSGDEAWDFIHLAGLRAAIATLDEIWHGHIPMEETNFGPHNAQHLLTPTENQELDAALASHGSQHALAIEFHMPFILYNLSGEDRAHISGVLPPLITQQLIPITWKAAWQPMQPFLLG